MRTEPPARRAVLYVFAHQDDEYGINSRIRFDAAANKRVICVYLTDGGANVSPETRNAESRAVLESYGVAREDIAFIGSQLRIRDGELHLHGGRALDALSKFIRPIARELESVYTLAWEGGHHDHDTAHAIVVRALADRGLLHIGRQYGLYSGPGMRHFFRVMKPPHAPGTIERRFSLAEGIRSALQCWRYPSQRRTWLGLFPEAAFRWIFVRREVLAPLDGARLVSRPHEGTLLYERLFRVPYAQVARAVEQLRS